MSIASAITLIVVVGAITYAMRAGLILALADRELPELLTRALRYVAPAVLAALVVSLIADPGAPNSGITVPELSGIVVAGPLAWWSRNLIVTVIGGMGVFWILLILLG